MLGMLTMIALGALDPCAPVQAAAAPDPAAAAQYRAVAEEERAGGDRDAAVAAWRLAAAADPADAKAKQALAALCREGARPAADPLAEATRLFDADRYREAAEQLHALQRRHPSSDAALLEGICRYELEEDALAARLLREAELDPAHRAMAQLYLGLIALRGGSARDAAGLLADAAANPGIASFASELARSARWDGPWLVSLRADAGYDSNVTLTSDGIGPSNRADALGGVTALAIGRPFGPDGLYVRAAGSAQQYSRLSGYDFTALEGGAGLRWWRGGTGVTAEYALASRTLGGSSYLGTNQLFATGAWATGPFTLSASWLGRWERYASTWSGFSGFAQRAEGLASLSLGARARLGLGWGWTRDATDDPVLAWSEQGPQAELKLLLGRRSRLSLEAGTSVRTYDEVDPAHGLRQRDVIVEGGAAWELDLGSRTTLRAGLLARNSDSNVPGFTYFKVLPVASIGVMISP